MQVPQKDVLKLVEKLQSQKGITIHHDEVEGADHFFEQTIPNLMEAVDGYLDMRLNGEAEE